MTPDPDFLGFVTEMVGHFRDYIVNLPTDGSYEESEKAAEMVTECRVRLEQFLWAFEQYRELREGKAPWRLPDSSTRPGQG